MTVVTNTFLTYAAVGNAEDFENAIFNISPQETPFMSNIGRVKCEATTHQWQTDALAAATTANAQIEGDDTTFAAVAATTLVLNTLQISNKSVVVSATQDAVRKYGRREEFAYQVAKKAKELKRDMETVMTGNFTHVPVASADSTTARVMRPLCAWYTTNDQRGSGGSDGSNTARAVDGTQRAFTEALLKAGLKACWDEGGDPTMLMVGSFNKQAASAFAGNATRMDKSEDKKLTATVDVYASDFGDVKIVPNRFSRSRDAHILDLEYWAMGTLRPFQMADLAKTGDATKKLILAEYTLVAKNQAASSIVADLSTS